MIDLDPTLQAAIDAAQIEQVVELLALVPPASPVERRTTYHSDLVALSSTWLADGLWVGMSEIPFAGRNINTLWTIDLDLRNDSVLTTNYEGGYVRYFVAFLGPDGLVIDDPVLMAHGWDIAMGQDREHRGYVTRTLEIHHWLWADQIDPTQHARTDVSQKDRFSGDRIFKDVALLRRSAFDIGGKGVFEFR